ncbi:MAG: hypothetical protein IPM32_02455 [Ignavibacteriae bacterium]|nr:hypothetical protein [Ignavibacteriota bacterium]
MKKIYVILFTIVLSGCYTEFEKRSRILEEFVEISDSTVFFPNQNFFTKDFSIKDLYCKWINSREEEKTIIKIYRPENYKEYKPSRFRGKINFYENGECEYTILEPNDGHRYVKLRWRLLKENPNIINLYNENGNRENSLRIEILKPELLKFVWVN